MKLYHGTNETVARKALIEGLKPRSITKTSNWNHTVASNKDAIYLTDTYPLYFALGASEADQMPAILEIDTDKLLPFDLVPDEDYLEQVSRRVANDPKTEWDMNKRNRWYRARLQQFAHYWEDSVKNLGNCAYIGMIPAKAITRIAVIDRKKNQLLCFRGMDPSISLINFKLCGEDYKSLVSWIFDGECPETERDRMHRQLGYPSTKEILEKEGRAGISVEVTNFEKEKVKT